MKNYNVQILEYNEGCLDSLIFILKLNTPHYFSVKEEGDFKRYLKSEIEDYYIVLFENSVIGGGGINYFADGSTACISWDLIHPEFQGKSIGSSLLAHRIERIMAIETIKKIIVRTSQLTYPFYQKHGFELIDVKKDYWDEGFDLYHMEQFIR